MIGQIKKKISKATPRHRLQHDYPYKSLWVNPPDPMMRATINVSDHHLRPVFVWLPEFTHPRALPEGRPPCPRCKSTDNVVVKGWTQNSRRAILRDSCCDLLGYFYKCNACEQKNKDKPQASFEYCALLFDLTCHNLATPVSTALVHRFS